MHACRAVDLGTAVRAAGAGGDIVQDVHAVIQAVMSSIESASTACRARATAWPASRCITERARSAGVRRRPYRLRHNEDRPVEIDALNSRPNRLTSCTAPDQAGLNAVIEVVITRKTSLGGRPLSSSRGGLTHPARLAPGQRPGQYSRPRCRGRQPHRTLREACERPQLTEDPVSSVLPRNARSKYLR